MTSLSQVTTDAPPASEQVIIVRPESRLAQGQYAWPAWGILMLGGAILGVASWFLVKRWRAPTRG